MAQPLQQLFPMIRGNGLLAWLSGQYRYLRFAALLLIASFSPGIHDRPTRQRSASVLCCAAWQTLPGFLLACVLLSAILTRVVAVSADSYGLSHLALEAILRVFIVELLPLVSTLFVAMRAVPMAMLHLATLPGRPGAGLRDALPYVVGNTAAVVILAIIGGIVSLAVAYPVVHGFNQWGLPAYSRLIGQVFDPILAISLSAKILFFGIAVGIAPATVVLDPRKYDTGQREMRVMVRLLLILVLIEGSFLMLRRF
jgi:phospholipid/cholesterol/gamma-HCH transport system permease protein